MNHDAYDTELARDATREDLEGTREQFAPTVVAWCTAGWEGVEAVEDLGTADNGGRGLARMTLYDGKILGLKPKTGLAQGHQVLVQIGGPLFAVPPPGTQVMCAFPGGDINTPGNGAILLWAQANPTQQFSATRAVLDMGPAMDLVLKGRTVTVMDHEGDAEGSFGAWFGVGPLGGGPAGVYASDGHGGGFQTSGGEFYAMASDGSSSPNTTAQLALTADSAMLSLGGAGFYGVTSEGGITILSQTTANIMATIVGLGSNPTLPILGGLTAVAGVPSVSVLVSVG